MTEATVPIDRKDLIEGLGKGLRIIEAFDDDHPRLSSSEAGVRAGITRTAARRYLLSLCHYGYAATDGRLFWLMPRVLRLGHSYLEAARLPRLVLPYLQRDALQSAETVNFSVLDGHDVVYVARSSSTRHVSIGFQPGARIPAHLVTPGYAILSTFDPDALERWIAAHEFTSFTPEGSRDPARFRDWVEATRALGYWVTEQQLDSGLRGIAMPLLDRKAECKGAIGMTVPMLPHPREQLVARMLPLLQEAAQALRGIL